MGHLLHQTLAETGVHLEKEIFVLGNLLPDYLPELILAPHFAAKCQREINVFTGVLAAQRIDRAGEIPAEYALRLGILCHYITDYFCFAHCREFGRTLAKHASYEQKLDDYFRSHYSADECLLVDTPSVQCDCAKDVASDIFQAKHRYQSAERSFQTDVQFAITTCLNTIHRTLVLSESAQHAFSPVFRFAPFAAEKYAFQKSVCKRKIVPRRAWCTGTLA
jgi:hypothetical protein